MTTTNRAETHGYERWLKASELSNEDSLPDVKKKQAQGVGGHVAMTASEAMLAAAEVGEIAAAGIAAPFAVGLTAALQVIGAHDEGEQLNAALHRDAAAHAVLSLGAAGFGERYAGFVEAEKNRLDSEYVGDSSARNLMGGTAMRMATQVTTAQGGLDNARKAVSAGVEDGIRFAEARNFRSAAEVAQFLAHANPAFRQRYETDPAFHLGVDAVVWRAQHPETKPS